MTEPQLYFIPKHIFDELRWNEFDSYTVTKEVFVNDKLRKAGYKNVDIAAVAKLLQRALGMAEVYIDDKPYLVYTPKTAKNIIISRKSDESDIEEWIVDERDQS